MKKENLKILIDENRQYAETKIRELKQQGIAMTELIKVFNLQPVLKKIETSEDAKAFLNSPLDYLNMAVIRDCGMTFGSHKPNPEQVATLFNIKYGAVAQKINQTRPKPSELQWYSFDESTLQIELMPESEEAVREQCKVWLNDPDEIAEYNKVRGLCDSLNEFAERYKLTNSDLNAIPAYTGLKCVVKPDGHGWHLIPSIDNIRKYLKHTL
jgi:hypothetical protein